MILIALLISLFFLISGLISTISLCASRKIVFFYAFSFKSSWLNCCITIWWGEKKKKARYMYACAYEVWKAVGYLNAKMHMYVFESVTDESSLNDFKYRHYRRHWQCKTVETFFCGFFPSEKYALKIDGKSNAVNRFFNFVIICCLYTYFFCFFSSGCESFNFWHRPIALFAKSYDDTRLY